MKTFKIVLAVVTVLLIVILSGISTRKEVDSILYNAANETRISGVVAEVQEFYCPVTEDRGTHVVVKTDHGPMVVHVAVARFLREHKVSFTPGERVEVVGAKIRYKGSDALIAREITRGDEVLRVRDDTGKPLW
jgi:hypothetical protein